MQCTNCHFERPVLAGPCPNCGFVVIAEPRPSLGRQNPVRLILACFFVLAAIGFVVVQVAVPLYRQMPATGSDQATPKPTREPRIQTTHFAVEHGRVAGPDDLHGHGKLYFVPVGRQAIFVRSLAEYYANKFGIQIYLLYTSFLKLNSVLLLVCRSGINASPRKSSVPWQAPIRTSPEIQNQ